MQGKWFWGLTAHGPGITSPTPASGYENSARAAGTKVEAAWFRSVGDLPENAPRWLRGLSLEAFQMTDDKAKAKIAHELYEAVRKLEGDSDLLCILGSYGDTVDDDDVLERLRQWNSSHENAHSASGSMQPLALQLRGGSPDDN